MKLPILGNDGSPRQAGLDAISSVTSIADAMAPTQVVAGSQELRLTRHSRQHSHGTLLCSTRSRPPCRARRWGSACSSASALPSLLSAALAHTAPCSAAVNNRLSPGNCTNDRHKMMQTRGLLLWRLSSQRASLASLRGRSSWSQVALWTQKVPCPPMLVHVVRLSQLLLCSPRAHGARVLLSLSKQILETAE